MRKPKVLNLLRRAQAMEDSSQKYLTKKLDPELTITQFPKQFQNYLLAILQGEFLEIVKFLHKLLDM
jgi:hypothetical protein